MLLCYGIFWIIPGYLDYILNSRVLERITDAKRVCLFDWLILFGHNITIYIHT